MNGDPSQPVHHGKGRSAVLVVVGLTTVVAIGFALWPMPRRQDRSTAINFHERVRHGALAGANLLFITLDTTRADHIGCYGYAAARTPTIDGLANRGVRFDHAVAGVPITLPSHCTMMTGLEAPNHGVRVNGKFGLEVRFTTLAEVLRDRGYATAAFVASYVLDSRFGLAQGFDHYDDNVNPAEVDMGGRSSLRRADDVTNHAINWLTEHDSADFEQPFFMWVHYFDAHQPYDPPPEYARKFANRLYDGEIAFTDAQLKRLIDLLEAKGLRENTLIVLTADHGEGLGEHHEAGHSRLIYDTTMHIPLIFSCPRLFDGPYRVDDVTVGTIDLMPTVLSLLGVATDVAMDGIDLATDKVDADRAIYLETLAPLLNHGWSSLHALRRVDAKYILAPTPELYDLAKDPSELRNVLARDSAAGDGLAASLASRMTQWVSVDDIAKTASMLTPEAERRLTSLGYLQTGTPSDTSPERRPDPKDMMPLFEQWLIAQALSDAGYHEKALEAIDQLLEQAPDQAYSLDLLSKVYQRLNRFDKAEEALRRAIEVQPNSLAYTRLAQFLARRGQYAEADRALTMANEYDPRDGLIFITRGDMLALQGKMKDALAQFERAEDIDPYRSGAIAREKITLAREFLDLQEQ